MGHTVDPDPLSKQFIIHVRFGTNGTDTFVDSVCGGSGSFLGWHDSEVVIELNCELDSKQVFIKCSIFDKKVAKKIKIRKNKDSKKQRFEKTLLRYTDHRPRIHGSVSCTS